MNKLIAACVAICALCIAVYWATRPPVLFEHQLGAKHRLIIRQLRGPSLNEVTLSITYHNPPALGMFSIAQQTVSKPASPLTFTAITDQETGMQCVFDDNEVGFLLLYDPNTDDLWDSTGRSGGWSGSARELWQSRLIELRAKHPLIPYSELPAG